MKIFRFAALAVLTAAGVSCIIPVYMDEGTRFDRSAPAFRRTLDFAAGGSLRIDNAYGNVVLIGWDREQVEVTAEETWDESIPAEAANLQRNNIVPRIDIETAAGNAMTIKARSRDEEFVGDRIVHLLVRVPHHVLLKNVTARQGRISLSDMYGEAVLRLDDGDVRVENYSGSLDAELVRGSIQAEMVDLRPEDIVRLVLGEGPVTLLLEPAFNGRVEADAPSGSIVCDFVADAAPAKSKASLKIGTGEGALVTISARRGSVTVRKNG